MTNDPFKNFKPLNSRPAPKAATNKANNNNSFVESMRDMGGSVMKSLKNDVVKGTAQSIFDQLLGSAKTGTAPDMNAGTPNLEAFIAERENQAAEQARSQERAFHVHKAQETKVLFSHADESLRKEIQGVRQELQMLVASMGQVEQQIEAAMMDNIVDGGLYHLNYFAKLKTWIKVHAKISSRWLRLARDVWWSQI